MHCKIMWKYEIGDWNRQTEKNRIRKFLAESERRAIVIRNVGTTALQSLKKRWDSLALQNWPFVNFWDFFTFYRRLKQNFWDLLHERSLKLLSSHNKRNFVSHSECFGGTLQIIM